MRHGRLLACVLSVLTTRAGADTRAIAVDRTICSRDERFCLAVLVPDRKSYGEQLEDPRFRADYPTSGLYRVASASQTRPRLLWKMDTSALPAPVVLNDGQHVIGVASGASLASGETIKGSHRTLLFIRHGRLTRSWSLEDTVPGWRSLQPMQSVSSAHHRWFCRVQLWPDESTLEVWPCPDAAPDVASGVGVKSETLRFDARNGARR